MRRSLAAVAAFLAVACELAARNANAYCRTMTCRLPADFSPSANECYPSNFAAQCAALNPPVRLLPLYWADACISYDLQKDASTRVPYDVAAPIVSAAFAKWTSSICTATQGMPRVGIGVVDRGPVDCAKVEYNSDQGNQHVIVFRDRLDATSASHFTGTNTLGLTTVTFNPGTGEIYDADTEINATAQLSVGDPVAGYDFESIITHELGHFLGLAHSADPLATMYAQYSPGSSTMRVLTTDDEDGLCSIYPGGLARNVDPSVAMGGQIMADGTKKCDGEPRHGFSKTCAQPKSSKGCAVAESNPAEGDAPTWIVGILGVASVSVARTRLGRRARATLRKR